METSRELTLTAGAADAGERLDRLLARSFADVSRARFQGLIADARVRVNGATIVEAGHRVKPGARIEVRCLSGRGHPLGQPFSARTKAPVIILSGSILL